MPTYDLKCNNNHIFEEFSLKLEPELDDSIECPICKSKQFKKLELQGTPIIEFNGPGFYATKDCIKRTL